MKLQIQNFKLQKTIFVLLMAVVMLSMATVVKAHVSVKPAQVGIGAFQTFTVGVPNEKEVPTTSLRLVIPEGLNYVTPNVKPGWIISVKKSGEGEEAKVTEISWTGGSIPAGQRDEFNFSAQTPKENSELKWKAYQTYQTGEIVAWDQDPNAPKASTTGDDGGITPYSVTKVMNDLQSSAAPMVSNSEVKSENNSSMIFSAAALLVSFAALGISLRKKS